MAVSLPSDIVSDVMRAASSTDVAEARARLAEKVRTAVATAQASSGASHAAFRPMVPEGAPAAGSEEARKADALKKFEAMVLQTFVQSMLPQDAESVYGSGLAGDMWKGLLAEKVAGVMAERGGIGIAASLSKDFIRRGDVMVPVSGVDRSESRAALDAQDLLSTALLDQMQRKTITAQRGDAADAADKG